MADQQPFSDIALASNPEPRCPCVLLVDNSASMLAVVANPGSDTGETVIRDGQTYRVVSSGTTRLDLVNEGLKAYQLDLLKDDLAPQRVEVSIITFGGKVSTVVPFTSAHDFVAPTLDATGETPMGEAIVKAIEAVEERKKVYRGNGLHYYRPWIFLITDGEPTDDWLRAAEKVRECEANKKIAFFAVGVEGANMETLQKISVRRALNLKGYSFREMFLWLSQSQRRVSHSRPGEEDQLSIESPAGWATL
jgi:uncharacterized protein YegL